MASPPLKVVNPITILAVDESVRAVLDASLKSCSRYVQSDKTRPRVTLTLYLLANVYGREDVVREFLDFMPQDAPVKHFDTQQDWGWNRNHLALILISLGARLGKLMKT